MLHQRRYPDERNRAMTRERLQRLLRLAILRGDRAAELIIRGHMSPVTESEKRALWGDR